MEIVNYYQTVWMSVAKYPVKTAIKEIYCCVVTLCLTCFYARCFSYVIIVLVKFSFFATMNYGE